VLGSKQDVSISLHMQPDNSVKVMLFVRASRAQAHQQITKETFEEAGWSINDKVQLGQSIEWLGFIIDTESMRQSLPDAKRLGVLAEMCKHMSAARSFTRSHRDVESLTGRLGHIAMVAPEMNSYLAPLYRTTHATTRYRQTNGRIQRLTPRAVEICAGKTGAQYQISLLWILNALIHGVSAPCAANEIFPEVGQPGVMLMCTDAAREVGTGMGGWAIMHTSEKRSIFFYMSERWSQYTLLRLQANQLSMPAGEALAAVAFADELLETLDDITHLRMLTDSMAVRELINSNNSHSPQLNAIGRWLFELHPKIQFCCEHIKGSHNVMADDLSRGRADRVISEARDHDYVICRLRPRESFHTLINEVALAEQLAPRAPSSQGKS
jgi:hypothetical protein